MATRAGTATRKWFRDDSNVRTLLAFVVTGMGIFTLWWVAKTALDNAAPDQQGEVARLVFASIVPLIGTWIGAVLAYYFTSQNLRAGSETALAAVGAAGGLAPETPVTSVMTRFDRIHPRQLVADEDAARALALSDLYQAMRASGRSRVPILTSAANPSALFVVHESDIDKYAGALVPAVPTATVPGTLDDLLKSPAAPFPAQLDFAVVDESATLAEARAELRERIGAKDVFVTAGGTRDGAVRGWLTNSDLARET